MGGIVLLINLVDLIIENRGLRVPVSEDSYWLYFGYAKGWGNKCDRCLKEINQTKKPGFECINCWKFEIWIDNLTDLTETLAYLLEEADKDHTLHGKMMKKPLLHFESGEGRLATGVSHSIPEQAKPDRYLKGEIKSDQVILIYNQSIEERDSRMRKIIGELQALGLYKKASAPYRRGCIQPHETIIGPWENWYDMENNYNVR